APGHDPRRAGADGAVLPRAPGARPGQASGDGRLRGGPPLSLADATGLLRRRRPAGRALRPLRPLQTVGATRRATKRGIVNSRSRTRVVLQFVVPPLGGSGSA